MNTYYLFNRETEKVDEIHEMDKTSFHELSVRADRGCIYILYWHQSGNWCQWHPDTMRVNIGEDSVPNVVRSLHLIHEG